MPTLTRELIINVRDPNRAGILRDFQTQATGSLGSLVRRDTEVWGLRLVEPSSSGSDPFADLDLTGASLEIGLGLSDLAPTGGTFSLSYGGNSTGTTALSGTITASALQTALNTNPARATDGPVAVTQQGSSFVISDTTTGSRSLLAADGSLLAPQSIASVNRVQTGSSTAKEIQVLTLAQANYAYQNGFTAYPTSAYTLTTVQAGDGSHVSIRQLSLIPSPYDGTWLLQGRAVAWNAAASDVQAALGTGYAVTQGDPSTASWTITQAANGSANALSVDASGLSVPKGAVVTLALNTYGMLGAFAATTANSVTLRLQGRLTLPGQQPFTFLLIDVPVSRDVLNLGSILPQLLGTYPPPDQVDTISARNAAIAAASSAAATFAPGVTSVGDGASGSLEAVVTTGRSVPSLLTLDNAATGALQDWKLVASTAPTASGIQRPNDYNASTNAKVWFQRR